MDKLSQKPVVSPTFLNTRKEFAKPNSLVQTKEITLQSRQVAADKIAPQLTKHHASERTNAYLQVNKLANRLAAKTAEPEGLQALLDANQAVYLAGDSIPLTADAVDAFTTKLAKSIGDAQIEPGEIHALDPARVQRLIS